VTIRRVRVKEAVTNIWWLSKTTEPQADNRQVLVPYSKSMKRLLKDGYDPAMRPSQHEIGPHFQRDNGGADPAQRADGSHTRSYDDYLFKCRAAGLPIHPARFPPELPDFFIRFLTTAGQMVVDPFAAATRRAGGGEAGTEVEQHRTQRRYVAGSKLRFDDKPEAA